LTERLSPTQTLLFSALDTSKPFNDWSKSKARLDKLAMIEPFTVHDLRRVYVTNLQRLAVPLEVREALVNHISGQSKTGVAGVYSRYRYWDEMCAAVGHYEAWFRETILKIEDL
jgi:hypothetical protein